MPRLVVGRTSSLGGHGVQIRLGRIRSGEPRHMYCIDFSMKIPSSDGFSCNVLGVSNDPFRMVYHSKKSQIWIGGGVSGQTGRDPRVRKAERGRQGSLNEKFMKTELPDRQTATDHLLIPHNLFKKLPFKGDFKSSFVLIICYNPSLVPFKGKWINRKFFKLF